MNMQEVLEKILKDIERLKDYHAEIATELFERSLPMSYTKYDIETTKEEILKRVDKNIKQAAAEYNNGWIPVEERLPEESLNSVLGWDEYRERCCLVQYVGGRWILGNDIDSVNITAWQPLPEPYQPKGEQDE